MTDTQYVYEITIANTRTDARRTARIVAPDLRTACGYAGWLMDWSDPHERVSSGTELETLPTREDARRAEDAIDAGTYQPPEPRSPELETIMHTYTVTVTTDDGSVVERRSVHVTFDNPVSNVHQALTGALNDMRRDIGMPPVTEPADAIDAQAARDAARYRD